jgi:fatty-acyl-CoA synthase
VKTSSCRISKGAEHNQGLWVAAGDGQRWLNTGDLGRQDSDGYFYLTGRRKELIIRGGHNIDPAAIEQPLHQHPAVLMAAAVGRPDAHAGEVPVAYVQLKPGVAVTEDTLTDFARGSVGERAAVPKAIRIVPAMPLTGVSKILKPALKLRETEDALCEALRSAGVAFVSVTADIDASHGTVIGVVLAEGQDVQRARQVLGQFPFRHHVAVGPDRASSPVTRAGAAGSRPGR